MRRADRLAVVLAATPAVGGCMVIYPDPELPDVIARWYEEDCRTGAATVTIALVGIDAESRAELTVPCGELTATFADVARERYRIEAHQLDDRGTAIRRADTLLDLRDGFDERAELYFGTLPTFRVAWVFADGATCDSLRADAIWLGFSGQDMTLDHVRYAPCLQTPWFATIPDGTYTLRITAEAGDATVAESSESEPFVIAQPGLADLGVITLTP